GATATRWTSEASALTCRQLKRARSGSTLLGSWLDTTRIFTARLVGALRAEQLADRGAGIARGPEATENGGQRLEGPGLPLVQEGDVARLQALGGEALDDP